MRSEALPSHFSGQRTVPAGWSSAASTAARIDFLLVPPSRLVPCVMGDRPVGVLP
jgi:hypothetical protein